MIEFRLPGLSALIPSRPSVKALPPIPTRSNVDIAREASERTRALRSRQGRGTILTDEEDLGSPVLTRPAASRSTLGG